MTITIVNRGRITLSVAVRDPDGTKGSVRLMPKARVQLPEGHTVDRNYEATTADLKVIRPQAEPSNKEAEPVEVEEDDTDKADGE